jgi:hypothetical protein
LRIAAIPTANTFAGKRDEPALAGGWRWRTWRAAIHTVLTQRYCYGRSVVLSAGGERSV